MRALRNIIYDNCDISDIYYIYQDKNNLNNKTYQEIWSNYNIFAVEDASTKIRLQIKDSNFFHQIYNKVNKEIKNYNTWYKKVWRYICQ